MAAQLMPRGGGSFLGRSSAGRRRPGPDRIRWGPQPALTRVSGPHSNAAGELATNCPVQLRLISWPPSSLAELSFPSIRPGKQGNQCCTICPSSLMRTLQAQPRPRPEQSCIGDNLEPSSVQQRPGVDDRLRECGRNPANRSDAQPYPIAVHPTKPHLNVLHRNDHRDSDEQFPI
jgi:hypothetical protein